MFKTVNKKNTNIFLKDKILRGVTGYKRIRFMEGYIDCETVDVTARLTLSYARCPLCGMKSHSVHSTYERQLMLINICAPELGAFLYSLSIKSALMSMFMVL